MLSIHQPVQLSHGYFFDVNIRFYPCKTLTLQSAVVVLTVEAKIFNTYEIDFSMNICFQNNNVH